MPAFTFEKISSPIRSTTQPVAIAGNTKQVSAKRSRSLIVNMMDRFTAARIEREDAQTRSELPPKRPKPD
jgi:hypothetical protein